MILDEELDMSEDEPGGEEDASSATAAPSVPPASPAPPAQRAPGPGKVLGKQGSEWTTSPLKGQELPIEEHTWSLVRGGIVRRKQIYKEVFTTVGGWATVLYICQDYKPQDAAKRGDQYGKPYITICRYRSLGIASGKWKLRRFVSVTSHRVIRKLAQSLLQFYGTEEEPCIPMVVDE